MNRVFTWIFQEVGFPMSNWWLGMQWLHLQIFINQKWKTENKIIDKKTDFSVRFLEIH